MKKICKVKLVFALLFGLTGAYAQPAFIWAKQMGGGSTDRSAAMVTDASGNVYTTGFFTGVSDFDPGPGTYTLAGSPGGLDIFISKLDASGNFLWAKQVVSGGFLIMAGLFVLIIQEMLL
jgi:hypothetical protein